MKDAIKFILAAIILVPMGAWVFYVAITEAWARFVGWF
jgi:hypothetical protein